VYPYRDEPVLRTDESTLIYAEAAVESRKAVNGIKGP